MDDAPLPGACPPHHWEVTLVPSEAGLSDHYRCKRCGAEKELARRAASGWPARRPPGRPRKSSG